MREKQYFVYIMANIKNSVLYTGVTDDLRRRVIEHSLGKGSVFTKKYKVHKLLYYEVGKDINAAITREKVIKSGSQHRKFELINNINPRWDDLYEIYFS